MSTIQTCRDIRRVTNADYLFTYLLTEGLNFLTAELFTVSVRATFSGSTLN